MNNYYVPLGYDLMAKKIFGNKNDIEPIKLLLKLILDLNVKKIEVLNNELIDRPYIDKKNSVDLLVELDDNTVVGIEINTDVSSKLIDRNVFYMARIMSMDLNPNEDYDKLKDHIQLNFDLEGHHERPIMKYILMDENNNVLTDKVKIYRIDIPYFYKICYNRDKLTKSEKELNMSEEEILKLAKFISLFYEKDEERAKEIVRGDKDLEGIFDRVKDYSEKFIGVYDKESHDRETRKAYMEEKTKEALEQGKIEEKKSIVLNMLKENANIKFISKVTGLSIKEIEDIKNSI